MSDRKYSKKNSGSAITIGDYFTAVESFLSRDDFFVVKSLVRQSENTDIETSDIKKIDIFLVKHGRFYHPSKIAVSFFQKKAFFVLNLAASDAGIACINREYPVLKRLSRKITDIPAVYEKGDVALSKTLFFSMFAAKWFEGYNEFHFSYENGFKKVLVWDYEKGFYSLSDSEVFLLYKQATKIMTRCYDIVSFEQIQPWHHAAGDFVVKNDEHSFDVKLITVRQYTPLFENTFDDPESLLEAALIFFISLSIRMRLDRIDGVKETVWADNLVLKAVVAGFFEALDDLDAPEIFEYGFAPCFKNYISGIDPESLSDLSMMVANSYHPDSSDYPIVAENIKAHIVQFEAEIKKAAEF